MMRTGRNAMRSAGIDARSGAPEMRFDAYARRQPVTESSFINSLAIRPCRSTIKTLPATLPEPWTVVRGQRSKPIGPWSTDLEPRILNSVSRFKLRGFPLVDAGPGVTWDDCWIWIEEGRGVGAYVRGVGYLSLEWCLRDGRRERNFVGACSMLYMLLPQPSLN